MLKLRHEWYPWQGELADGWCEGGHRMVVIDEPNVDHENCGRRAMLHESHEARQVTPGPVPHNRMHDERQAIRHCATRRQQVEVDVTSGQLLTEMKSMASLGKSHRRKSTRND